MSCIQHYSSPLGTVIFASDGKALTGLWFEGQKFFGSTLSGEQEEKDLPVFRQTVRWLNLYFEGKMNNNEAQNSEIEQIPELYDSNSLSAYNK